MSKLVATALALVCAFHQISAGEPQPKPRMSKRQVIAVAKRAIEARFPWAAAKHYSYDAFLESDGMWGVYVPHPHEPGVLYFGGGDPNAEVRDRDGKVLKVYLAR